MYPRRRRLRTSVAPKVPAASMTQTVGETAAAAAGDIVEREKERKKERNREEREGLVRKFVVVW